MSEQFHLLFEQNRQLALELRSDHTVKAIVYHPLASISKFLHIPKRTPLLSCQSSLRVAKRALDEASDKALRIIRCDS